MARKPPQKRLRPVHEDRWIKCRASTVLLEALTEHAHSQQRTLSNFVRFTLTEKLKADGVIVRDDERVSA